VADTTSIENEVPADVYMQVMNVHNRYTYHLDAQEFELAGAVYTDDATFDTIPTTDVPGHPLPARGRGAIVELIDALTQLAAKAYANSSTVKHLITNVYITEYNEDRLRAFAYLMVVRTATDASPSVVQVGTYEDVMVRGDNGRWRIETRTVHKDVAGFVSSR
jgi:3-phenylpropionate/cinnamic acid dioxygenase small subunit